MRLGLGVRNTDGDSPTRARQLATHGVGVRYPNQVVVKVGLSTVLPEGPGVDAPIAPFKLDGHQPASAN